MTTGQRIAAARTEKGLTMRALAAILKVDPMMVFRWEHDTIRPSHATLKAIAAATNVTLTTLLTGHLSAPAFKVVKAFRRLSPADQRQVREHLKGG